jgi:hypothetical protein
MDLTPLLTALSALGPWGIVAGIGITLLLQFLRNRLGKPAAPLVPLPNPSPATNPQPLDKQFPLLARLAQVLGITPRTGPATTADIPHDLVLQLRSEVDRLSAAKAAGHAAALADLTPPEVPAARAG